MPRCSAAGLNFMEHFIKVLPFRIIPAGFNALLEFLTGFTTSWWALPTLHKSSTQLILVSSSGNISLPIFPRFSRGSFLISLSLASHQVSVQPLPIPPASPDPNSEVCPASPLSADEALLPSLPTPLKTRSRILYPLSYADGDEDTSCLQMLLLWER